MDSKPSDMKMSSTNIYPSISKEMNDAAKEDQTESLLTFTDCSFGSYTDSAFRTHFRGRPGIHDASNTGGMHSNPSFQTSSFTMHTSGNSLPEERSAEIMSDQPLSEPVLETNKVINNDSLKLDRYFISIVAFCICVLLPIFMCTFFKFQPQPLLPQYLKEIESLKSNSDQQTDNFWNIIKSFPYDLLSEKNPNSPAVLLMVAPADGISRAFQLTQQIADTLNRILNSDSNYVPIINGSDLVAQGPDEQKLMIDEQIRNFVENQKQRAVVVTNLEKIDPMAIMIFHAYCDNSEAVYKDIAIILLLELPAGVSSENEKNIFSHLTQIWSQLGKSTINALFTRLANNIAILNTE